MTDDPSKQRDDLAKAVATERSDEAAAMATRRFDDLVEIVAKLASDVQTIKGNLTANTFFTTEALDNVKKMVEAVEAMKGGVKVLGWIERPAKWLATIVGAGVAFWALWQKMKG
jgi:hypothetical protein